MRVLCWQKARAWATSWGGPRGQEWGGDSVTLLHGQLPVSWQSPLTPHGDSAALPEPGHVCPVLRAWGPPGTRVRGCQAAAAVKESTVQHNVLIKETK